MNFAAMLEPPKLPKWTGKRRRHVLCDEDVAPKPKQKQLRPKGVKVALPRMTMTERHRMNCVLLFNLGRAMGRAG